MTTTPRVGAWVLESGEVRFRVWAPDATSVDVVLEGRELGLRREPTGHWAVVVDGVAVGERYRYRVDGRHELADPASMAQPDGVHGASAIVAPTFDWTDEGYRPTRLSTWVLYELHVGTFTADGTFDAVIGRLDELAAIGVNTVELMPIAEFPGRRNWGYDGVFPFAAHHTYGGLDGLRRLVDACHARAMALVLDVVYNHVGPEGAVLEAFGPYFTDRYRTPWGRAMNFEGPGSDFVRELFLENACFWARHAHVDGFRVDAVHAIADSSAYTFVEELTRTVHACGDELARGLVVIAESADNDSRLTAPIERGGRGYDAQWSDDFHHAVHVALTGEQRRHYADFQGGADLAEAFVRGFVYRGRYSAFRGRRHGRPDPPVALERLVVFDQNHDQIGNRARGERLITLAGFEAAKTALACTLLAPSIPLLFMGEERAARSPFPYFVSHSDPELVAAVRHGRLAELHDFGEAPLDPGAEATFRSAVLDLDDDGPEARATLALCHDLLALRRRRPELELASEARPRAVWDHDTRTLVVERGSGTARSLVVVQLPGAPAHETTPDARSLPDSDWRVACDTAAPGYHGPGRDGRGVAVPSALVLVTGD